MSRNSSSHPVRRVLARYTVARVLAARKEDAALVQNGSWLLLTRTAGELRRHRHT
ncbi:SitI3 family protein [Verrucosispora sp. WMMA2044]|uniref:SitI3 family protein n=1 Tax=Verrucosispora sp. WMMA2044 TaxID=3016419 RepID=UPI0022A83E85|nr:MULTISPECIES: SitI3 family protein [Micromonospora]WBB47778.1 SitI3 family protein [Verrucosispora sp. WMMA2044]